MNQLIQLGNNVRRRWPRTPEEKTRLAEAIVGLLRTIPDTWATFDSDTQTAIQSMALDHLTAAGLVERRHTICLSMADAPTAMELRFEATGEAGFAIAWKQGVPRLLDMWQDECKKWQSGASANQSPFHSREVPPAEWRLSDQGVIARDGLGNPEELRSAIDFVLKQGFFGPGFWGRKLMRGQVPTVDDQRTIAEQLAAAGPDVSDPLELPRPPVTGEGRLLAIRKVASDSIAAAAPLEVNVVNWASGVGMMSEALKTMFSIVSPLGAACATAAAPKPDGPFGVSGFSFRGKQIDGIPNLPWKLLDALWKARERTLEFDEIVLAVWGDPNEPVANKTIQSHCATLRKLFRDNAFPCGIKTGGDPLRVELVIE